MSTESAAQAIAKASKAAFEASQLVSSEDRIKALYEIRDQLDAAKDQILEANKKDLAVSFTYINGRL